MNPVPVPPLPAETLLRFLVAIATLLLIALVLGRLAERLALPAIVGELFTGVLLGPSLLGHLLPDVTGRLMPGAAEEMYLVDAVAQVGVLLLVGVTGTHLDLSMLRRKTRAAATISLLGLVVPMAGGIALGLALPPPGNDGPADAWLFAGFLGVAMGVTALPVIAKTLSDMGLLHRTIGQLTLAAGTIDDAIGWFLLSIVAAAAATGLTLAGVGLAVLKLVAFVLLAATAGRVVVRKAMRLAARSAAPGPTVATAVIVVVVGAVTTHALGMEPIFGAFVAGMLVGRPRAAHQPSLAPLRVVVLSVLAPIFMASAGLRMDLTALADPGVALTALAVLGVAVAGKFAGAYAGARLSGLNRWEGLAVGAGMNSRGVVEVIVATTGLRLGVLDVPAYTTVVLVAVVTSLMAPPLLRLTMARVASSEEERLRELEHRAWGVAGGSTVHKTGRER